MLGKTALIIGLLMGTVFGSPAPIGMNDVARGRFAVRAAEAVAPTIVPVNGVSRSATNTTLLMEISAYSPTAAECDGNPTRTASGKTVYVGGIAADLSVLPFGSQVIIPNYNGGKPCIVIDTGGAIKGNKLDVFFWHEQDAVNWGRRRNVPVRILYISKE